MREGPLNQDEWFDVLGQVAQHLQHPSNLIVIGSAVGILSGQPTRTSIDLDVWRKGTKTALNDLKQACLKAGVLFNPKEEVIGDTPYIQIVDEGIVQVGKYQKTEELAQFSGKEADQLQLSRPPIANLIASKLLRAHPKDLEDIAFLMGKFQPERGDVEKAIASFPPQQQETARENLIYLDVLGRNQTPER